MHDLLQIVELLEPELGPSAHAPAPLSGGITNHNYRARLGEREYVIRVPGKDTDLLGIDREAERVANERAAGVGVAPAVAAFLTAPPCIVTAFVEGAALEPKQLREPATLARVAAALRAVHGIAEPLPSRFDSFAIVADYATLAAKRGVDLPAAFEPARERAELIRAALSAPEHEPVPCHNDLLAANFIGGDGDRLWIVDWEYAGMGNRYFDLANFAVNNELGEAAEEELLGEYLGAAPGPPQLAALRLMRFMSDFREAMWGVVQGAVSELDFDFASYAERHFDRLRETGQDPRFDGWLREARAAG